MRDYQENGIECNKVGIESMLNPMDKNEVTEVVKMETIREFFAAYEDGIESEEMKKQLEEPDRVDF